MFDRFDNYETFMGRWSRRLAPRFAAFAGVAPGERLIDVGTGTGVLAAELLAAHEPRSVVAVDPSPEYVEHARRLYRDPRVRFEEGDASALRFEDGTFDRCLSLLVLSFVAEPLRAVREMRRVTRPGGIVAAAVWDYADGMRMLRLFWDAAVELDPAVEPSDERHLTASSADELWSLWREAGLRDVAIDGLTVEQSFRSFDDYWKPFLMGTGPAGAHATGLSPERREVLRARLRRAVPTGSADGPFTLHSRAWAIRGVV